MSRPGPPSGAPPPRDVTLADGSVVALTPLADLIARRYLETYPDEAERYGPAGEAWCVHDNLYVLAWAFGAQQGDVRFEEQILWLARVLHSRGYPLDRLAQDLRIAAEVVLAEQVARAAPVAATLRDGAACVERYASELVAP